MCALYVLFCNHNAINVLDILTVARRDIVTFVIEATACLMYNKEYTNQKETMIGWLFTLYSVTCTCFICKLEVVLKKTKCWKQKMKMK